MHVAFVTPVDPTGESGQNLYSRSVAVALARRSDVALTLVCPEPERDLPLTLATDSVTTRYLPAKQTRSLRWQFVAQWAMAVALLAANRDQRLDGLVAPLKTATIVPWMFALLFRRPYVLLVEGLLAKNVRRMAPFLGAGPLAAAIAYGNAVTSQAVFAAYPEAREWIASMPLVNPDRVALFRHGVNPDLFTPDDRETARGALGLDFQGSDLVVGYVGSFKQYHCLDLLVRASERARSRGGLSIHLLLVGDGPRRGAVEDLVDELGLCDAVTFPGFVSQEQVPTYIAACDVAYGVIAPDHWGSPMKVYESLACGRPVVVHDDPEFAFVAERDAGFIVERATVDAVASALERAAETPPTVRDEMGATGREHVLETGTWDVLAQRIVDRLNGDNERTH